MLQKIVLCNLSNTVHLGSFQNLSPVSILIKDPLNVTYFVQLSTAQFIFQFQVFSTVYTEGKIPDAVTYLTGDFQFLNDTESGLLAPMYFDQAKQLYLFSHHPRGKVWQVSTKLSTTPLRGVHPGGEPACPDNDAISWEWFNTTTTEGQQLYVQDNHIHVKCVDHFR
jgi:hypothetical protein